MLTEAEVNATMIKKIAGHSGAMTLTERVYTPPGCEGTAGSDQQDLNRNRGHDHSFAAYAGWEFEI